LLSRYIWSLYVARNSFIASRSLEKVTDMVHSRAMFNKLFESIFLDEFQSCFSSSHTWNIINVTISLLYIPQKLNKSIWYYLVLVSFSYFFILIFGIVFINNDREESLQTENSPKNTFCWKKLHIYQNVISLSLFSKMN
jgi:hypothetical protein